MYQVLANFSYQNFEVDPVTFINQVVNQWRNNGQIIGREFGVTYNDEGFQVRVATPAQDSLLPTWNSEEVNEALLQAGEIGVKFTSFEVLGRDYQAEQTSEIAPAFHILYTTHLDSCSPIYNGTDFCSQPLYHVLAKNQPLAERVLKWQEDWQACDQLQMNGSVLEEQALAQISDHDSPLASLGRELCAEIEQQTQVPTFYYLYRLGDDEAVEHSRHCPSCNGKWKLAEPLHDIFYFKCDKCRLVSNLSWEVM